MPLLLLPVLHLSTKQRDVSDSSPCNRCLPQTCGDKHTQLEARSFLESPRTVVAAIHPRIIHPSSTHHPPIIHPSSTRHPPIIHPSSTHHTPIIHPSSTHHPLTSTHHPPIIHPSSTHHPPIIHPSSTHHLSLSLSLSLPLSWTSLAPPGAPWHLLAPTSLLCDPHLYFFTPVM